MHAESSSSSRNGKLIEPIQILRQEEGINQQIEQKRREWEAEAGLSHDRVKHFARPEENPFTRAQRDHTTILFGGLSKKHDRLIEGAWRGLGYRCEAIPTPDVNSFQLGKEYGNNAQCNPTYFTVGNLIKYLHTLEKKGWSRHEIIDKFVFITAGACGPCRFGMYEAEYRLALLNSGFEGFRVILFQQSEGINHCDVEAGLEMNLDFYMALINAIIMGDMLNELAFQIRPYEVEPGQTNRVMAEVLDSLYDVLRHKKRFEITGNVKRILAGAKLEDVVNYLGKFLNQLLSKEFELALNKARDCFNKIEVDRFRVKPIVKITGEFWAQATEGDGNFNMFRFLEDEGAEVFGEPVGTWILYLLHQFKNRLKDRKGIKKRDESPWWRPDKRFASELTFRRRLGTILLAEKIFKREYSRLQKAMGGTLHELVDQHELQRMAHPFYNSYSEGGEGHLEVAKNIYYHNHDLSHMVLSLKPFGCLPSTQSDGAQAAVVEHFHDMIFLPIETSGEGEVNAHSRVQMALGNARLKTKQEFKNALTATGKSLDELKAYVDQHPELTHPFNHIPHRNGITGTAANFVYHVADLMDGKTQITTSKSRNRTDIPGQAS